MANIKAPSLAQLVHGGTWGNANVETVFYRPEANLTNGDTVDLLELQADTELIDSMVFVEDALASLTLSLGYVHINGEAGSDAVYFGSAVDVAAGGRFRAATNKPPVRLAYDSYLRATFAGAAFPATNAITVVLWHRFLGHK